MLKDFIKEYITPELRKHKFKKKGNCWNRLSENNFIQVIDFQLGSYSSEDEGSFTVNVGIFDSNVWEKCWGKEVPNFIREENCFLRLRVGEIIDNYSVDSSDIWWKYNLDSNIENLSIEIIEILEKKCIPFFEKISSYIEVDKFLTTTKIRMMPIEKVYWAIIKYEIKQFDASKKLLNEVSAISEVWQKRVQFVESQLTK